MAGKNIEVVLKDVRGSFLNNMIFPEQRKNDAGEVTGWNYPATFLIKKTDTVQVELVRDAMRKALAAAWAGQDKKIPAERRCLRDGEPKDEDTGKPTPLYEGYEGCWFLSTNVGLKLENFPEKPTFADNPIDLIVGRKGADGKFPRVSSPAEALKHFYSGAYFDIIVRIYGYDGKKHGNPDRINASLTTVKFKRHGEAFGSSRPDSDNLLDDDDDDIDDGMGGPASSSDDDDEL